jgi:hypothetical protein
MEVTAMLTSPPDDAGSLPERSAIAQDAVLITRWEQGAPRFPLATMRAEVPCRIADHAVVGRLRVDVFDDAAQLVISEFVDAGSFGIDAMLVVVARMPSATGAARVGRHRRERGS